MITPLSAQHAVRTTIWGLNAHQLHDRFWAARGVQVIRMGQQVRLVPDAELFLLTDPHTLTIFRLAQLVDAMSWLKPSVLFVRLHNTREQGYTERVVTNDNDRFIRFERVYGLSQWQLGRVALTSDRLVAEMWQQSPDARSGWRELRRQIRRTRRTTMSVQGSVYDSSDPDEPVQFVRDLVQVWKRPDITIRRARAIGENVWGDIGVRTEPTTRFIGPIWIGAGRTLDNVPSVVGPAVLWDAPDSRPDIDELRWREIQPADVLHRPVKPKRLTSAQRLGKRVFDFMFAALALLCVLPIFPLVMLAIFLEDGRPFFFAHRRESMGGVEFPCLKFRTMRKDAEQIKQRLMQENQADGPQFFMDDDPRLTRVGKVLRKFNIDELPQFFNVLVGHMAIVGPRPSPYKENQFCPAWRELRLSVRPGITGLWQVYRSREAGRDFQEWIRFDIAYVENMSWRMDAHIIWHTCLAMAGIKPWEPPAAISPSEHTSNTAAASSTKPDASADNEPDKTPTPPTAA